MKRTAKILCIGLTILMLTLSVPHFVSAAGTSCDRKGGIYYSYSGNFNNKDLRSLWQQYCKNGKCDMGALLNALLGNRKDCGGNCGSDCDKNCGSDCGDDCCKDCDRNCGDDSCKDCGDDTCKDCGSDCGDNCGNNTNPQQPADTATDTHSDTQIIIRPSNGTDSEAQIKPSQPADSNSDKSEFNEAYEDEVIRLVNAERAKYGLSALAKDNGATKAAHVRAKEIVKSFSHTRPNGTSCFTVAKELGISYRSAGENIAYGYSSPKQVVNGWMNSEGHRKNILSSSFTKIGVGCYSSRGVLYWSQFFMG